MVDTLRSERDAALLEHPRHRSLGLTFVGRHEGRSLLHFAVAEAPSAADAGLLCAALDVACLLALHPMVGDDQPLMTHGLHVAVMRELAAGSICSIIARVLRRSRVLSFAEAEARCGSLLIATAHVTRGIGKAARAARTTP